MLTVLSGVQQRFLCPVVCLAGGWPRVFGRPTHCARAEKPFGHEPVDLLSSIAAFTVLISHKVSFDTTLLMRRTLLQVELDSLTDMFTSMPRSSASSLRMWTFLGLGLALFQCWWPRI